MYCRVSEKPALAAGFFVLEAAVGLGSTGT